MKLRNEIEILRGEKDRLEETSTQDFIDLFQRWALEMVGEYSQPVDRLEEKTEQDRVINLLNENLNSGYDEAIRTIRQRIEESTKLDTIGSK